MKGSAKRESGFRVQTMSRVLCLVAVFGAVSIEASELYTREQLYGFISDVSVFEGQFYSVYDYCSPYAGEMLSALTLASWKSANNQLLHDRDRIVEDLIKANGLEKGDADNLRMTVQGFIDKARGNNRLYKDLISKPDKLLPCSQRMGAMNSTSMNFKSIAPVSYEVWRKYNDSRTKETGDRAQSQ